MAVQRKDAALSRQLPSARTELADLYEHDYYAWTGTQAQALRERKISGLDWENLAEEVEDLGKAERHRLESHFEWLLIHLAQMEISAAAPHPHLGQLHKRASLPDSKSLTGQSESKGLAPAGLG